MMFTSSIANNFAKKKIMQKKEDRISFIETRFGKIKINLDKVIHFPNGLLGMPDKTHFCLANFPDPSFYRFKILQSLDDEKLAFITLPLDEQLRGFHSSFSFIEKQDIEFCANLLGVKSEDMGILLITSVHHFGMGENKSTKLSVNVRAPLIIDSTKNSGLQFVFPNEKYLIQQFI